MICKQFVNDIIIRNNYFFELNKKIKSKTLINYNTIKLELLSISEILGIFYNTIKRYIVNTGDFYDLLISNIVCLPEKNKK